MLFLKELQSVKPGIIFNKVSGTLGDSHQRACFTKYLRYYDNLWQLRGSNHFVQCRSFANYFYAEFLFSCFMIWVEIISWCFISYSLCRWSPHQSSSAGGDSLAAANWMDSQEWDSHHDIPCSIHGKTGQWRNHYQKLDCMLQLDSYYIVLLPLYPWIWYWIDFHNITGSWWQGLEWGGCDLYTAGPRECLVWKGRPGEPQTKHSVHGPGLKSK